MCSFQHTVKRRIRDMSIINFDQVITENRESKFGFIELDESTYVSSCCQLIVDVCLHRKKK